MAFPASCEHSLSAALNEHLKFIENELSFHNNRLSQKIIQIQKTMRCVHQYITK